MIFYKFTMQIVISAWKMIVKRPIERRTQQKQERNVDLAGMDSYVGAIKFELK